MSKCFITETGYKINLDNIHEIYQAEDSFDVDGEYYPLVVVHQTTGFLGFRHRTVFEYRHENDLLLDIKAIKNLLYDEVYTNKGIEK